MKNILIGRKEAQETLINALASDSSELVGVFGRRRVGKTYLVKHVYQEHITFEITGLEGSSNTKQLGYFSKQIDLYAQSPVPSKKPKNWLEAFFRLANFLDKQPKDKKQVVFLDELPWLAAHKSEIIMGLSWFWNSWAERRHVVVVISGSAVSWMIQKVVNDRGGLHNRITKRIFLYPFTLAETEAYLQHRHIFFDRYQITQIYMILGGIPDYLKEIQGDKSVSQNINDLCFSKNGLLHDEFSKLYPVLFANPDKHIKIVKALAAARQGLSCSIIRKNAGLSEEDNTPKLLQELDRSGFITDYYPFEKNKKEQFYRLTDEYSLFYFRFIEHYKDEGNDTWQTLSQTQSAKEWADYAYANACLKHIQPIKKALGISGVYTQSSTFLKKGTKTKQAAQIDLLIDRNDRIINLFEIKFCDATFVLSETEANTLRHIMQRFRQSTGTKRYLIMTLMTTFGIEHNKYSLGLFEKVLTMDALFL